MEKIITDVQSSKRVEWRIEFIQSMWIKDKIMNWKYKVVFISRVMLALAHLELTLWRTDFKKYLVKVQGEQYYILTSSNDVLDVISESLKSSSYDVQKLR